MCPQSNSFYFHWQKNEFFYNSEHFNIYIYFKELMYILFVITYAIKKKKLFIKSLIIIGISLYAYLINWNTGNIGVLPIDTFGFLESGNSILKGSIPIRDFWIFTGIVLDYIQALFILMFGNNWNSYVAHASFINILATLCVFFLFRRDRFR